MANKISTSVLAFSIRAVFSVHAKQLDASEVPAAVISVIRSKFPDAKNIMIEKELHFRTSLHQVRYQSGSEQNYELFDLQGRPFGHEETIDPGRLPGAVNRKLETSFGIYSILGSQKIRHPDGRIEYEVVVKGEGSRWELAMSPSGNILTKNQLKM